MDYFWLALLGGSRWYHFRGKQGLCTTSWPSTPESSATLTLPDYGRFARNSGGILGNNARTPSATAERRRRQAAREHCNHQSGAGFQTHAL